MNLALWLMTALSLSIFALRLARTPLRQAADWWATLAAIGAVSGVAWLSTSDASGFIAFGSVVVLLVAPLQLDRAAQTAMRAGRIDSARRFSRVAALLHPLGAIGRRPWTLLALSSIRDGTAVDDAMLRRAGADDPVLREWFRVVAMTASGDHAGVRLALALPARRATLLQLGLGTHWVRTVAETAHATADVVAAIEEAERLDPTLDEPERRALFAMETCAALGDVTFARRMATRLSGKIPPGSGERAVAAAQRAAGDVEGARATLHSALARTGLDPAAARSLSALRRTLDSERAYAPAGTPRAEAVLSRLRREVEAEGALAPLRSGSLFHAWVTGTLATAMVGYFIFIVRDGRTLDRDYLVKMGGLELPMQWSSQAYRLLTLTMVHASWLHLGLNVYALIVFGRFVETFFGRVRILVIYIAAAIGSGSAVALLSDPNQTSGLVGASGAIFGLGGAIVAGVLRRADLRNSRRGRDELKSFALLFAFQMVFDRIIPNVSGTAHVAGMLTGFVMGAMLVRSRGGAGRESA